MDSPIFQQVAGPIKPILHLTSVMLVPGANSIIGFTFCFIGEIPFPDTKCPNVLSLIDLLFFIYRFMGFQRQNVGFTGYRE